MGSSPRVRGKLGRSVPGTVLVGLIPACAGKTRRTVRALGCRRAHPRVCGENVGTVEAGVGQEGSSPRVRGKRSWSSRSRCPRGLIPACAGKTTSSVLIGPGPPAHPRVCGENVGAKVRTWPRPGSSPRVRGKPGVHAGPGRVHGLIPACAGKTISQSARTRNVSAHPRVCGENLAHLWVKRDGRGSSPRVRGKQAHRESNAHEPGLIPACAGKTSRARTLEYLTWAHPRVCGENGLAYGTPVLRLGSSPRVRGKPHDARRARGASGLIPACAGKTPSSPRSSGAGEAHPRVCGENRGGWGGRRAQRGSSPRVRGKPRGPAAHRAPPGLIPACAGKTRWICSRLWVLPAHPRVCGENRLRGFSRVRAWGSSPRVRGKHVRRPPPPRERGLIPACAGKTAASRTGH